jgi:hypothetical protein
MLSSHHPHPYDPIPQQNVLHLFFTVVCTPQKFLHRSGTPSKLRISLHKSDAVSDHLTFIAQEDIKKSCIWIVRISQQYKYKAKRTVSQKTAYSSSVQIGKCFLRKLVLKICGIIQARLSRNSKHLHETSKRSKENKIINQDRISYKEGQRTDQLKLLAASNSQATHSSRVNSKSLESAIGLHCRKESPAMRSQIWCSAYHKNLTRHTLSKSKESVDTRNATANYRKLTSTQQSSRLQ